MHLRGASDGGVAAASPSGTQILPRTQLNAHHRVQFPQLPPSLSSQRHPSLPPSDLPLHYRAPFKHSKAPAQLGGSPPSEPRLMQFTSVLAERVLLRSVADA